MVSVLLLERLVVPVFLLIALLQIVPHFFFIHPYVQMLLSASGTVFIGCVRSIKEKKTEAMTSKDAYMFPVIGSGVLFSLYILIKFVSKEYLNMLLGVYFCGLGILVAHASLRPILAPFLPSSMSSHQPYHIKFQIPYVSEENGKVDFTLVHSDFVTIAVGTVLSVAYMLTKNWVLNNLFGVMFSIQGIENISIGSIKIGVVLLCGLFLYDIFWVFGTDVMVTVAKGFQGPIKLLFPKSVVVWDEKPEFSMVGLGDIVIPGIYVAMMLRFDHFRNAVNTKYFPLVFGGYVAGLVATVIVMHTFNAAQPALLYLVPGCLLTSLVPAFVWGETKELFEFTEETTPEETVEKKKD
jgi:minor histocompatibility antigen H13